MHYEFRKSAIENEKRYTCEADRLVIVDLKTEEPVSILYENIKKVNLEYFTKRYMADTFLCHIYSSTNKKITLNSHHYNSFASFENRKENYVPFIKELHNKLAERDIVFSKGMSKGLYWFQIIGFTLLGLAAFAVGILVGFPQGIFVILGTVLLLSLLRNHFKFNKPGNYNPRDLPKEMLP